MQNWGMRTLTISITCFLLTACAGKKIVNTEAIQLQSGLEANQSTLTPSQAINIAESKYAEAIEAELNIYAPIHLIQALDSIKAAKEALSKGTTALSLKAAIAAEKFINGGYNNKKTVQSNLQEVLQHDAALKKLEAPVRLPKKYDQIQSQLIGLIELIEKGQTVKAINEQASLMLEMSALEIQTLKHKHLSEAYALIEKIDDMNADKYAPMSLNNAVKLLQTAEDYINKNYRNRKGVKQIGQKALWEAQHAYFVAVESKNISELDAEQSEQYILDVLSKNNTLYQTLLNNQLKPQTLANSNTQILTAIKSLKTQLSDKQQTLNDLKISNSRPILNTISETEEEVFVLRNLPAHPQADSTFLDEPANDEPKLQVDEQGFDDIEQMSEY